MAGYGLGQELHRLSHALLPHPPSVPHWAWSLTGDQQMVLEREEETLGVGPQLVSLCDSATDAPQTGFQVQ